MNPDLIMRKELEFYRLLIFEKFPFLDKDTRIPLVFWRYLFNRPEKFLNWDVYTQAIKIYSDFYSKYPTEFSDFFSKEFRELNLANRNLSEINLLLIHDNKLNDDQIELINFCDNSILPNYLRLIEGVYHVMINPIVTFTQLENGKKPFNQKIFNRCEYITKEYPTFSEPYSHVIRNAIAHGGVIYGNNNITFQDDNNIEEYSIKGFIRKFDDLLDFCNAMILAFLTFYYINRTNLSSEGIVLPTSFIFEEIKMEFSAPKWDVRACIESETHDKRNQLNIYIGESFFWKTLPFYYSLQTVQGAVKLCSFFGKSYSRIFISYSSKYYPRGFIGFDGEKIAQSKKEEIDDISTYRKAIDVEFISHRNPFFNRLWYIASYFKDTIQRGIPLWLDKRRTGRVGYTIEPRAGKIFRTRFGVTIRLSIVITSDSENLDTIIRNNVRKIVKDSIKFGRGQTPLYDIRRYLPISLVFISVMSKDFRERKIECPGLIPELVCTIRQDKGKHRKIVDINGGIPEII